MNQKQFFLLLFSLLCIYSGKAQVNNDAGSWLTFSLQHPLTKKVNLVIDEELRLKENYQRINLFYTNVGIDYKMNNFLKISPTYRSIQKMRLDGTFSYRHRLMLDVTLKKKFNKFSISERARYQIEVGDYNTSEKGHLAEQYLRLKTEIKYALNKIINPYVSCELRYQIRDPKGKGPLTDYGFHRIRNVGGLEFQIKKSQTFNLYYLIQSEYYIADPETIYILGIGYTLTI